MQKVLKALFALTITQGKLTCNISKDELVYVDSYKFVKSGIIVDVRDFPGAFAEQPVPVPNKYPILEFTADYQTTDTAGNTVLIQTGTQFVAYDRVVMVQGAILDLSKMPAILKPVEAFRQDANLAFDEAAYTVAANATVQTAVTKDTDADVTYASSDEAIATVDETGLVTGVAEGEAVITAATAQTDDYKAGSATCTVTVTA